MARLSTAKIDFSAGEVTGLLAARTNTQLFGQGCEQLENFWVLPQGSIQNRPGTQYLGDQKDHTTKKRLIPFEFNVNQAYAIEFGNLYVRFWTKDGFLETSSGSGVPREVVTPYATADLPDLQYVQSGDILYIVHPSYKPRKLERTGAYTWSLTTYTPTADPFGADGSDDCPRAIAFYEQRLWFGGSNNDPQKIWASIAGDFEDMTTSSADTSALTYTVAARQINPILWLFSDQFLLIGTASGVFVARGSGFDQAITPTNVQIKRHISTPAKADLPVLAFDVVMMISRLGKKLFGLFYDGRSQKYNSADATRRNNDVSGSGISQLAFQNEPHNMLWAVRDDGQLVGCTFDNNDQMTAFHRHITDGEVESVCVHSNEDGDVLFLMVKRTINGATKRYIECLEAREDKLNSYWMDCALKYSGADTSTITGLSHLEGEEVSVVAAKNGAVAVHPNVTVSSGQITLQYDVDEAYVGLGYTAKMRSMRLAGQSSNGTALGKLKRIHTVVLQFYKTAVSGKIGQLDGNLRLVLSRSGGDDMDKAPDLLTGDVPVKPSNSWDRGGYVYFETSQPAPVTILGMTLEYEVNDG